MSGTGEDISQVHWKQQWLENGTLYFHVSMTESEVVAQTTQPSAREPAHGLHEHMHLLHISVMVSCKEKQNKANVQMCVLIQNADASTSSRHCAKARHLTPKGFM